MSGWVEDGSELVIPRLGHGYLFVGFRRGALLATTYELPSLERVVGGLWDLAAWARKPWKSGPVVDWRALERRERRHAKVLRIADVAIVTLAVALLRRWS